VGSVGPGAQPKASTAAEAREETSSPIVLPLIVLFAVQLPRLVRLVVLVMLFLATFGEVLTLVPLRNLGIVAIRVSTCRLLLP
jgi:hypothetical protein